MYQKTLREWDKQRLRIEMDYRELANRVDYLSNEVGKECALVDRLAYAFTRLFLKNALASLNFAFYSPSWFSWDSLVDPGPNPWLIMAHSCSDEA